MLLRSGWAAYLRSLQNRPLSTKASAAALIFFTSDVATQFLSSRRSASAGALHSDRPPPPVLPDDAVVPSSTAPSTRAGGNSTKRKSDDMSSKVVESVHGSFLDAFQVHRSVSAACFGVVSATWLHYWWNALEGLVAARLPLHAGSSSSRSRRLANALVKVAIDQALAAPLYTYAYYVVTNYVGSALALRQQGGRAPLSNTNAGTRHLLMETHAKARDMLWPTMRQHYKLWPMVHLVNFYAVPLQHRVLVQNTVLVFWSAYLSHLNHHHHPRGHGHLDLMAAQ